MIWEEIQLRGKTFNVEKEGFFPVGQSIFFAGEGDCCRQKGREQI